SRRGHGEGVDGSARHSPPSSAYARGARYFEAARSHGEAEAFLAAWLARRGLGPSEVTVGSKWGYRYTTNSPARREQAAVGGRHHARRRSRGGSRRDRQAGVRQRQFDRSR